MVSQIGFTYENNRKRLAGLTDDVKPTVDVGNGSTFRERDGAKRLWQFDSLNINPATGTNWWEV